MYCPIIDVTETNLYSLSQAQRDSGNYPMTHKRIHGLAISIETPKGDQRRPEWPPMAADYGYIKGTMGRDGDHVDVFIGPNLRSETVYVIDQSGASGKRFDEHKVMLGFYSRENAIATYSKCYEPGWLVGPVTTMTIAQLKNWLSEGDQMKPVHKQVSRYSNLADLHLPYNSQPFIERYQAKCDKERYEWNESNHPRFQAGSVGGVGGQFRGREGSNGGPNYITLQKIWHPTMKSFSEENAEIAVKSAKVASMPGLNKSSKIRDVASPPSIAREHDLHWSKAGDFSKKIFDWHLELNRAMRDMTLEHTANVDGTERDHKWEQAWQAGDKTKVRELLAQMNAMDKEARAQGINLASIVNANGLIPRELAERLSSGSRFFDPERLRDQIKEGNKKAGIKPQPVQSKPAPKILFTGDKKFAPKPLPATKPQEPAEQSPKVSPAPSTPEQMQSVVESAFSKLSKQGQKSLDSAIRTGMSDDGEELPSDMVAELRDSVLDTWKQIRSQAEDFNLAYDQVVKGINEAFGWGKNNLRARLTAGTDYDKIPGFDQAADFARNHFPHLLTASSGESDVKGQDDHLLAQAIIRGKMDVPEQPWHPQVIDEARKRIGPALATAGNAPEFAQDPDDPEYVPFSLESIVDEVMRYMAAEDFCFSA